MPPTETQLKRELKKDAGPWIVISRHKEGKEHLAVEWYETKQGADNAAQWFENYKHYPATIIAVSQALAAGEMVDAFKGIEQALDEADELSPACFTVEAMRSCDAMVDFRALISKATT